MKKTIIGVYSITHLATGRVYVGSSVDARKRMSVHRWLLERGEHHSQHLQSAWNLYGADAFSFAIVEACDARILIEREQFWIERMRSAHSRLGFNIAPVAGTRARVPQSLEARAKMSLAHKGRPKSAEHAAKIGAANKGQKRSAEMRKAQSVRMAKELAENPAKRAALLATKPNNAGWNKGQKMSPESRAKMSAARKGKTFIRDAKGHILGVASDELH